MLEVLSYTAIFDYSNEASIVFQDLFVPRCLFSVVGRYETAVERCNNESSIFTNQPFSQ